MKAGEIAVLEMDYGTKRVSDNPLYDNVAQRYQITQLSFNRENLCRRLSRQNWHTSKRVCICTITLLMLSLTNLSHIPADRSEVERNNRNISLN